jgi:hypothetical protein
VGAVLGSCGGYGAGGNDAVVPAATEAGQDASQRVRGVVGLTGSEPSVVVVLRREAGGAVALTGGLAAELRRLSGATVTVVGVPAEPHPMPALEVREYQIELINGVAPVVGTLRESGGGLCD